MFPVTSSAVTLEGPQLRSSKSLPNQVLSREQLFQTHPHVTTLITPGLGSLSLGCLIPALLLQLWNFAFSGLPRPPHPNVEVHDYSSRLTRGWNPTQPLYSNYGRL